MIKNEQEHFMKEALKEAKKAYEKLEVPVGAVIVKDGKIIADIRTNTGINVNFLRDNFTKTPPKVLKINILYDITVLYKKQLNWYYIIDCVY